MERSIAVKKLRAMLGKEFGYRINPKAPSREEREAAKEALPAARDLCTTLNEKKRARLEAVLAADAEYQTLKEQYTVALRDKDRIAGRSYGHKISVGKTVGNLFFMVKAEGDSWEEIFAKLKHSRPAPAVE